MDIDTLTQVNARILNHIAEMRRNMPEGSDPTMNTEYLTWLDAADFINKLTQEQLEKEL